MARESFNPVRKHTNHSKYEFIILRKKKLDKIKLLYFKWSRWQREMTHIGMYQLARVILRANFAQLIHLMGGVPIVLLSSLTHFVCVGKVMNKS